MKRLPRAILPLLFVLLALLLFSACRKSPEPTDVRIASLKGPTTIGLLALADDAVPHLDSYSFVMETEASAVAARLVSEDCDIALLPANLAAILFQKTDGAVAAIDINTLGVLYCVTGDETVRSVADLAGKTVYLTGQGTTPEYVLRYLLERSGITDCTLVFKSEATEVAAVLAADPSLTAVLPQPFATAVQLKNTALREAFSLTDAWDEVSDGSRLLTGVTVVRKAFLEAHPDAVSRFLDAHRESASYDAKVLASLAVSQGIIASETIAEKALPKCGLTCVTGDEMKRLLSGYLSVLYAADPASVGGSLPSDSFYYAE